MSAPRERRQCPRAKIKLPVAMDTAQELITGETIDIGVNGAFITCAEPLKLKQIFNLAIIDVPLLDCRLVATAKVVWSNIHSPDDEVVARGMGVQFIRISSEDRKYISAAVSGYLAAEYDRE